MSTPFTGGQGAIFVQVNGPNTQPVWLGCHQMGDVERPRGDVEPIYCPDPAAPNTYQTKGAIQGAAGSTTFSIETDVTDELDYLENLNCPIPVYVNMVKASRMDLFTNADRTFILPGSRITSEGLSGLTARTPDDNARSTQSYDFSAESLFRFIALELSKQTTTETENLNDISFCNSASCRTDEDPAQLSCQTGFIACDAASGVTANILTTTNGSTWAATSADPFAADEHAIAVECFETARDTTRVVVARGSTDASNPPEIAYSDDSGATWTAVDVGSDNGEFVQYPHALFARDRNAIWLGTDQGVIYKSEDAAVSWTQVDDGTTLSAEGVNAIHFIDADVGFVVGDANTVARSLDGGASWSAITGPAGATVLNCVYCHDRNRVWVGTAAGTLYYSNNGGTSWSQRSITGSGVGQVKDVKFMNEYIGYLLKDVATPANGGNTMQYTIDGGYTWVSMTTPDNDGLNSAWICDIGKVYAVGEAVSSVGYIMNGVVA